MTLIECFTNSHIDNIAACLRLQPDKMIMVGNAEDMCEPIRWYEDLLEKRGLRTKIEPCDVSEKDFGEICGILYDHVRRADTCVIDLTGGEEPVIMAVGALLSHLDAEQRQRVRVEKYDHAQDAVLDIVNDSRKLPCQPVSLSVEELIALHGAKLHPEGYSVPAGSTSRDLDGLWSVVADAPKDWNRAISLLSEFESRADSKTQVYLPLEYIRGGIDRFDEKEDIIRNLLDKLQRRGVIDDQSSRYALEYTYRSPLLRHCTLKAGNMLEVKTLLEGRAILENGTPFFQDCRMGVSIDWDGMIYDPMDRIPETRNEIDVVLMHGTTPLFISCKNGYIGDDELYKLHTVASRFGGPYARKMLIATDLDRKSLMANRAFVQRAWDMDIYIVTDAAELTAEEFRQTLRQAVK